MADLKGRHKVSLGSSLSGSNDVSYHGIRLNFQPGTVDHTRPSHLSSNGGDYTLSVPSTENATHAFKGPQVPSKDVDCLLIYDEETSQYTIERLDSVFRLDHQRATIPRPSTHRAHGTQTLESTEKVNGHTLESTKNANDHIRESTEKVVNREIRENTEPRESTQSSVEKVIHSSERHATIRHQDSVVAHEEMDDEDEDDLDDLANMLESTLDEARCKPSLVAAQTRPETMTKSREEESSEEED